MVAPGGEVAKMFLCPTCGQYWYKVQDSICCRSFADPIPNDALERYLGKQDLLPWAQNHIKSLRRKLGL